MVFCEGLGAVVAAAALKAVAVFSEFLAAGIAVEACDFVPSVYNLDTCRTWNSIELRA